MPKIPAPYEYPRTAPDASRPLTAIDLPSPFGAAAVARGLTALGATFAAEAERLDETIAEDNISKVREKRAELTHNPDTGFTRLKGGAVANRPLLTEYGDAFDREVEAISSSANMSPKVRAAFNARVAQERTGFRVDLMRHIGQQTEEYHVTEFERGLKLDAGESAMSSANLRAGVAKGRERIEREIVRRGLTGDSAKGFRQDSLGMVHAAAIGGMLQRGDSSGANGYFQALREEDLPVDLRLKLESTLKEKSAWILANTAEDDARALHTAGKSEEEINQIMQERFKDDEKAYANFKALWHNTLQDIKVRDAETAGQIMLPFYAQPTERAMTQITSSDSFIGLPATTKATLTNQMRTILNTERSRNRAEANAAQSMYWHSPEYYARYDAIRRDPTFIDMSVEQMAGQLRGGGPLLTALRAEQDQIKKGVETYEIPQAVINSFIPDRAKKPQADAFKGIVAMELHGWKTLHPGKVPSNEDVAGIMRTAQAQWVSLDSMFYTEVPASKVPRDEAERVEGRYVPKWFFESMKTAPFAQRERWALFGKNTLVPDEEVIWRQWKAMSGVPETFIRKSLAEAEKRGRTDITPEKIKERWDAMEAAAKKRR